MPDMTILMIIIVAMNMTLTMTATSGGGLRTEIGVAAQPSNEL
jgi:hypothetical protein